MESTAGFAGAQQRAGGDVWLGWESPASSLEACWKVIFSRGVFLGWKWEAELLLGVGERAGEASCCSSRCPWAANAWFEAPGQTQTALVWPRWARGCLKALLLLREEEEGGVRSGLPPRE